MRFHSTGVTGVTLVEADAHHDDRGSFERAYCRATFADAGIDFAVRQTSISSSLVAGTLRGMHYQRSPHREAKLVRCIAGTVFDAVVDLRPDSPSFKAWYGVELSPDNGRSLYIPPGVAHGFLCLVDGSVLHYMMDADYEPTAGAGVRWDDPTFGIKWPRQPKVMSPRDSSYPNFGP